MKIPRDVAESGPEFSLFHCVSENLSFLFLFNVRFLSASV